jgi:hypothetical protein
MLYGKVGHKINYPGGLHLITLAVKIGNSFLTGNRRWQRDLKCKDVMCYNWFEDESNHTGRDAGVLKEQRKAPSDSQEKKRYFSSIVTRN